MTLKTKDAKYQRLLTKKHADFQFKKQNKIPSARTQRKLSSSEEEQSIKNSQEQDQRQNTKKKSKPLRKRIQQQLSDQNKSTELSIKITTNNNHQPLSSALIRDNTKHPKIRRKFTRRHLKVEEISMQDRRLILFLFFLLLLPGGRAANTPAQSRNQNDSHRNRLPGSAQSNSIAVAESQLSLINNSIPLVTNPFSSTTPTPIPPVRSIYDCHLLWSRYHNVTGTDPIKSDKFCFRKLTNPDSKAYDLAVTLGTNALKNRNDNEQENIIMSWPIESRGKILDSIHRGAGINYKIPDDFGKKPPSNEFEELVTHPNHREILSSGESQSTGAVLSLKFNEFEFFFNITSDSQNVAYYELQQDLLNTMLKGDINHFNKLISLGVKIPKLTIAQALSNGHLLELKEFTPISQSLLTFFTKLFSARSLMITKASTEFIQSFYNHPATVLSSEDFQDDIAMAAVAGRENVLSMLSNIYQHKYKPNMNGILLLILDLPDRAHIIRYLLQHGANLHKPWDSGVNQYPLFIVITKLWHRKSCQDVYFRMILEHCPDCIRKYQIDDVGTVLHILIHNYMRTYQYENVGNVFPMLDRMRELHTIKTLLERDPSLIHITDNQGRTHYN